MTTRSRRPPPDPAAADAVPTTLSDAALDALRARYEGAARAVVVAVRGALPVEVALREALAVADFIVRRWEPAEDDDGRTVPGLVSTASLFGREVVGEIRALHALASAEDRAAGRARRESIAALKQRGRALVRELDAAGRCLRDLGGVTAIVAPLKRVQEARAQDGASAEAIADALEAYAAVVGPHAGALEGKGGFRAAVVEEAVRVAEALRERPAAKAARRTDGLRDGYMALLAQRVGRARAAARFVFRAHPEVLREATSAWERAKRRRRKK